MNVPKHILVIRLSAMGDVAMAVPVLNALAQHYPDLKITVLTRAYFAPFFQEIPNVSVFSADVNAKHKGVFGLYKLSKELKTLQFDAVADLHNVLRSKILKTFLFGKRFVRIDKGRVKKRALISGQIFEQLKTTHQRYADVFETLGFKVDLSNPEFPSPKALSENCIAVLGEKSEKWIGIAPFAQYKSKMYPLHLMQEVIQGLSIKEGVKILLFGGGHSETNRLKEFESINSNIITIADRFSLHEELEIISNLDVMLSMDSANAHMAAMLGKKVVTIWGVTHPYAGFYPFGQDMNYALLADREAYPKIPTSVYGNKFPEDYKNATSSISVKDVIDKVLSLL